jgi:hypothetical protein
MSLMLKHSGIGICPMMPENPPLSSIPLNAALNWRLQNTASPYHSFWLFLAGNPTLIPEQNQIATAMA